jgi:beta-glucosidase
LKKSAIKQWSFGENAAQPKAAANNRLCNGVKNKKRVKKMSIKKILSVIFSMCITISAIGGCTSESPNGGDNGAAAPASPAGAAPPAEIPADYDGTTVLSGKYAGMTAEEITALLTLPEKAAQMSMAPAYGFGKTGMEDTDYGAILSGGGGNDSQTGWYMSVLGYNEYAGLSNAAIPILYGFDSVHGVSVCQNAVIFPHNIGIGAANDPDLTYKMGLAVADEMKLCGSYWNYAPCVAQATDPRWGRTYESFGTDLDLIKSLSLSYMKGNIDGGILACPKHFIGDGNVMYGTGEGENLMDRGDAVLSETQAAELLDVYKELIDAGAMSIMLSHSSVNGVKMHENKEYIDIIKNDWGFKGFIAADWDSVDNTSGATRKEQVINSVNAGLDMLMQMSSFDESRLYIIEGVEEGLIPIERVDDAVTRILRAKITLGIFDNIQSAPTAETVGSDEYRDLARQLVEKSQVLVKNTGDILPLRSGTKLFVTGPAADNVKAQCGGWTLSWTGTDNVPKTTTILEGLRTIAPEAGIELVDSADAADAVLLVIGEDSYAEWYGDSSDISITGVCGLQGNAEAIKTAKASGKPTIALIIAGRNVIISEYEQDWDAVVMGYLPGSEGDGVANVLTGKAPFSGKLPMPWYQDISQIGTEECWLPVGYAFGD